ncbi:hypothetical protein HN51_032992 [Arachis hypogaea]|uniref:Homeobox domain-containing protein n=1 Tax=Arachis hypogaea TaxID=3818 RepID=A0A445B2G7_ARAHY|nr:BEL1-like homeodomain protein 1 [Arachis hypogaea]XP_025624312.1 BEL1-like homeodomain protein 1 [Arachis hypogaea]XP_025624313.1 BEL1-like homeodomain protein 1 [Arachis hypogaea]XP_025624314.1 BEL1-like homeodomain protein 1 [Arachis hypogaea]QHO17402.1 BEL1-like homeodomain protein [Arachis hypogaea]QHO17403.1 BEL1-like homeodomain protein [Arachis hypogaea]QHO17404.1 BEL1-like homeodomain protein [Arachis hypogaea]RYR32869.1 hypothetical protein Ahy_A10g047399 isoform A [Arachis hypog
MATYFHGNSEIQAPSSADGLQTLVLMNPPPPPPPPAAAYIHYPDAPPPSHAPANLLFLNSSAAGNNSFSPHAPPPHTQQFVGIPLSSQDINHHHDVSALHGFLHRMQYNPWTTMDPTSAARETPRAQQGLSLSLSSQQAGLGSFRDVAPQALSGDEICGGRSTSSASAVTNGGSSIQSVILSSKYLKAAHELLEEVVNVNNAELATKKMMKTVGESSTAASGDGSIGGEGSGKRSSELSSAERQEISLKKAKLLSMLDEVEQRYRQYQQQMEVVVSSFEQAAGIGSGRTYTALALQTISKQFRCLKDAITRQIKGANKSLGEEEGSRLKYVDHHLRQQRALQQLGMIQHNAWRPQRGLPERSVSLLRAWLFEHFLHPYPKDSDKHMLAKQTGLTRSQVSNWFINARVRLWKPMVEEMYAEEMKDHHFNNNATTSDDKSNNTNNQDPSTKIADKLPTSETESHKQDHNTPVVSPLEGNMRNQPGFSFIMGSSELEGITQHQQGNSPKKPRISNNEAMHSSQSNIPSMNMMDVKPNEQGRQGYSFMGNQTNFISGFGQYPSIGDMDRFDPEQFTTPPPRFSGNGVSLTLGLDSLPGTHHQSFLPNQNIQLGRSIDIAEPNDFVGAMNTSSSPHSSAAAAFESIGMQNPKRFAAQLLPDFVA